MLFLSSNLFTNINSYDIGVRRESDHFPVLFKLSFIEDNILNHEEHCLNNDKNNNFNRFKWNENKKTEFLDNLKGSINNMKNIIIDTIPNDINLAVHMIVNMYTRAAKPMQLKTKINAPSPTQSDWWDESCDKLNQRTERPESALCKVIDDKTYILHG